MSNSVPHVKMEFGDSDRYQIAVSLLGITFPPIDRDLYESDLLAATKLIPTVRAPLIEALKNSRDFNLTTNVTIAQRLKVRELDDQDYKLDVTDCIQRTSDEILFLERRFREKRHAQLASDLTTTLNSFSGSSTAASTIVQEFITRELAHLVYPKRSEAPAQHMSTNPKKVISRDELRARAQGKGVEVLIKVFHPNAFAGLRYSNVSTLNRLFQTEITLQGARTDHERTAKINFKSQQSFLDCMLSKSLKGVRDNMNCVHLKLASTMDPNSWNQANITIPAEISNVVAKLWQQASQN